MRSGPFAHPVRPTMRSAKVHNNLADQAEADELHAEGHHEHRQQQGRTIRDALALDPLDQEHRTENDAATQEQRADQTEEAEWLLGELRQEEKCRDVEDPPEVHSRSVDPRLGIARMLRHRYFIDPKSLAQCERRYEPMEIAVQRKGLRHRSFHDPNTTGHVMEPLIGYSADNAVEETGLGPI